MLTVVYPLAFLSLIAVPLLLGIYFLRNRFRKADVSSMMLWSFAIQPKEGGKVIKSLMTPLSLLIELLIIILLVCAAAGISMRSSGMKTDLTVILDDSFSMEAMSGGSTSRMRAERFLFKTVDRLKPASIKLLITGDYVEAVHSMPDAASLKKALSAWRCRSSSFNIARAMTMAGAGHESKPILILTDTTPDHITANGVAGVLWRGCGHKEVNAGITAASRIHGEAQDRCFVELSAFGGRMAGNLVVQSLDGTSLLERKYTLSPGVASKITFEIPAGQNGFKASISDDGFAADNSVILLGLERRKIKIRNSIGNAATKNIVTRALDSTDMCITGEPADLVFSDSQNAEPPGPNVWHVVFSKGNGTAAAFSGPYVTLKKHPLMEGTAMAGAVWGYNGKTVTGGTPVLSVGDEWLISDEKTGVSSRRIVFRFDPDISNIQDTPNWPVIFWNLAKMRVRTFSGYEHNNLKTGADALLRLHEGKGDVSVTSPDGSVTKIKRSGPDIVFRLDDIGIFKANDETRDWICAGNLLNPEESDLTRCSSSETGALMKEGSARSVFVRYSWVFALLALMLMAYHLLLTGVRVITSGKGGAS